MSDVQKCEQMCGFCPSSCACECHWAFHNKIEELESQVCGLTEARERLTKIAAKSGQAIGDLHDQIRVLTGERDKQRIALDKINYIRQSIVGSQQVNWSEHIYPLVAALNEAGLVSLEYGEARENFGQLFEQNKRLRDNVERLDGERVLLRNALFELQPELNGWQLDVVKAVLEKTNL